MTTQRIIHHSARLASYWRSCGISDKRVMELQRGYFDNAFHYRQLKIIEEVGGEI